MNKSDVVDHVAGAAEVSRQQAERVIDAFFDTVKGAAKKGDRIAWPGFGAFSVTQRKARTGRNPRTGDAVKIPASKALKFTPGSAVKEFLNAAKATAKKAAKTAKATKATKASKASKASKAAKVTKTSKTAKATKAAKKR